MPQQTATKYKGTMDILIEDPLSIQKLRAQRQAITGNIYEGLDRSEQMFRNLETVDSTQAVKDKDEMTRGLEHYRAYATTIADLTQGLNEGLDGYIESIQDSKVYQGKEWVFSKLPFKFTKAQAHRWQMERVKTQTPEQNLEQILRFGVQAQEELLEGRRVAQGVYDRLSASVKVVAATIEEYQPREQLLKEKRDAMDLEYMQLKEKYSIAPAAEQAKMVEGLEQQGEALNTIKQEYQVVFTRYRIAQEMLSGYVAARESFAQMIINFTTLAEILSRKINDGSVMYKAAPPAVKLMLAVKGTEMLDKGLNVAWEETLRMIQQADASIADVTASREAAKVIEDRKLMEVLRAHAETIGKYAERAQKTRDESYTPQGERFARLQGPGKE